MKSKSIKKISRILFLLVGIATVLEFLFVQGMFTAPMVMLAVAVTGTANIVLELADKQYLSALHYLLTSVALCMGYGFL